MLQVDVQACCPPFELHEINMRRTDARPHPFDGSKRYASRAAAARTPNAAPTGFDRRRAATTGTGYREPACR